MKFELDGVELIGLYRSSVDLELKVTDFDGVTHDWSEIPTNMQSALADVAGRSNQRLSDPLTTWYVNIQGVPMPVPNDGGKAGDESDGEKHDTDDQGDQGYDAGDDQDGDTSDQDSDGGDESGDESGDNDKDGEPMSDEDLEKVMENFDPKNSRTKDGDEDAPTGSPVADDIWKYIKPNVEATAASYAVAAAGFAIQNGRPGPAGKDGENGEGGAPGNGGSGQGRIVVSPGKVGKVTGRTHKDFDKVVRLVARGLHTYIPGVPGTGKSHMCEQVAEALGMDFSATSFSPQATKSDLLGFRNAMGEYIPTAFRQRYEFGGLMLGDELDNCSAPVFTGLNSGLANGFMEFPDGMVRRHPNFVFVATANTLGTGPTAEFSGRTKLDPASLNRFMKVYMDTDEEMETGIVYDMIGEQAGERWLKKVRHCRRAVAELKIKHFVTMRDSVNGAKAIAPGDGKFTELEALEMTVLGVLTEDQKAKIKAFRG